MTECYTVASAPFEAACKIDSLPEGSAARRLHGHSYLARVRASLPSDWAHFSGAEVTDLQTLLQQKVAPLDHRYLNDIIETPTNENIARWLDTQWQGASIDKIGVQSTAHEGVDIDQQGVAHSWKRFRFEAAHQLPNVPAGHQCGRMHGHGFEVILHAHQSLNQQAMGVDLDVLEQQWATLQPQLHLRCLNDIKGLENPTSERLCAWIWQKLKPSFSALSWVSVYETATAGSHYDGVEFRIWKEFNFDSAIRLKKAPQDSPFSQLHGHSYLARLHVQAPLDTVMGWTVDYGDVKLRFKPVVEQLDHHDLSKIESLQEGSTRDIALLIKQLLAPSLPQMNRIDLYEQQGNGTVLNWGPASPALPI